MDLAKMLAELREELANLDSAILSLKRLQAEGKRRGRPPKALAEARKKIKGSPGRRNPKRPSEETR
jgi:hypothetical protein